MGNDLLGTQVRPVGSGVPICRNQSAVSSTERTAHRSVHAIIRGTASDDELLGARDPQSEIGIQESITGLFANDNIRWLTIQVRQESPSRRLRVQTVARWAVVLDENDFTAISAHSTCHGVQPFDEMSRIEPRQAGK